MKWRSRVSTMTASESRISRSGAPSWAATPPASAPAAARKARSASDRSLALMAGPGACLDGSGEEQPGLVDAAGREPASIADVERPGQVVAEREIQADRAAHADLEARQIDGV